MYMQKIYAVYCRVILEPEPKWLQDFRLKYDEPYEFHLTLKQSAYIEEAQLEGIKKRVAGILAQLPAREPVKLRFDKLLLDEHDDEDGLGWIYLFCSQENKYLASLQKALRQELQEFSQYLNPFSAQYEQNFNPHITIARQLSSTQFKTAVSELPKDAACTGEVSEIILSCVNEVTPEESTNADNLTVYKL